MVLCRILPFFFILSLCFHKFSCEDDPSLKYARPRCRFDTDCRENAFCFGNDNGVLGHCKCRDEFEMFTEGKQYDCLREGRLGDDCKQDKQCKISGPQAICTEENFKKRCRCKEEVSHEVSGACYETKLLDEFCLSDENCLLPDSPIGEDRMAICSFGVCSCPIGLRPSENKRRCIQSKALDEQCESDAECQVTENAVCRTFCTCEAGFTRSLDGKRCLRAALKFGEPCSETEQCSRFLERSVCENSKCSCPANYHEYETKCKRNTKPDEPCFEVGECIIFKELENLVTCTRGVCECIYGKSYNEKICLPSDSNANVGSLCILFICSVAIGIIWF